MTSFGSLDLKIDEKKTGRDLVISQPVLADIEMTALGGVDDSNLLIISDKDASEFKLTQFENVISFDRALFTNLSLVDVFKKTKFLWFNIRDSDARYYISRNLKDCPFKILLVYTDKSEKWIEDISKFLDGKVIKLSDKRLRAIDSLNSEDLVADILKTVLKISKPMGTGYKVLNALCCKSSKKKAY